MAKKKNPVAGAPVEPMVIEHLDIVAHQLTLDRSDGVVVNRADVIRMFLNAGLEKHPVTEDERRAWRKKTRAKSAKSDPVRQRPKLVLAEDGSIKNNTERVGLKATLLQLAKRTAPHRAEAA